MGEQAAHGRGAGAVEGEPEEQQAQVQQVALCCVPAPGRDRERAVTLACSDTGTIFSPQLDPGPAPSYLLSCWNKASSTVVLSSTVMDTTAAGASAPRGKTPGIRTSCQSERILQMSTESKNLQGGTQVSGPFHSFGLLETPTTL